MMLQDLLDGCLEDASHIMPLYSLWQKRIRASGTVHADEQHFNQDVTTIGKIPEEFMINVMAKLGGIALETIVKAKTLDEDGPRQLKAFAFQLRDNLKLPTSCLVKEVTRRALATRYEAVGSRLAAFLKAGGIAADGAIDWRHGSYTPRFDKNGALESVDHVSGDSVKVSSAMTQCVHSKNAKLCNNWPDDKATIFVEGVPPFNLAKLFDKTAAPHVHANLGSKPKVFNDFVGKINEQFQSEVAQLSSAKHMLDEDATATQLLDVQAQKKRKVMTAAREKAMLTLKAKQERRTISLTTQ